MVLKTTVLSSIEEKMGTFTSAQRKVADYILKNPTDVAFLTIEQLAGLTHVSVATVMRLSYSIGYTGFSQFQKVLQEMLRSRVAPPTRLEQNVKKIGKNKLLIECAKTQMANISKTVEFLSEESINDAFDLIFAAKKIYVIGIRGSGSVASFLNEGLNPLGIDCELLVPDTARLQAILARLTPDDLIIAISLPRYAKRTIETVEVAKNKGAKLLVITDSFSSPLAILADTFLVCSFESRSFHNSQIGTLFIADFLITGVATRDSRQTIQRLEGIEDVILSIKSNVRT